MPNWCHNFLQIAGPDTDTMDFMRFAGGTEKFGDQERDVPFVVDNFMPVPDDLSSGSDIDRYNWRKANWGIGNGVENVRVSVEPHGVVLYTFLTPWGTFRREFVEHMSSKFPNLDMQLEYIESGAGYSGVIQVKGGVVSRDLCGDATEEDKQRYPC